MEPFGFVHFINTTWNTVIKFLDKVNWNVTPDVLQHFPQLLQVYGSSVHFLLLHVRSHLLDVVHVRTLGRAFYNCQVDISLLILQVSLDYPSCVLRVVFVLENKAVTNKRLSNGHGMVDEYLFVFGCCKVISDLVQMPDSAVSESQTCRGPAPRFTAGETQSDLLYCLKLFPKTSNFFPSVKITFLHSTGVHVL